MHAYVIHQREERIRFGPFTMEMNEVGSLQIPDQVNLPFAISSSGDNYVIVTKGSTQILQLKYKHINEDGALNYILTRFECSKDKPTGQLASKEKDVYNLSNRLEKAIIMLDQTIVPNIATLNINNVSASASPPGIFQDYNSCLVAHLTNIGQLTLQRYDKNRNEWNSYVDVSSAWIAHFYDNSVFRDFKSLVPAVYEALITSFCWRDQAFRHVAHFAIGTKSAKIAIYSLLSDSVRVQYLAQTSNPVRNLKWITISEDRNLLLAGLLNGKIVLYSFKTLPDGDIYDFVQLNDIWADADDLTIGHIEYEIDHSNQRLLVLIVKGTHLLAFVCSLHGEVRSVAIQNMNNFMITGLQQLFSYRYILCTLPGSMFCVEIKFIKTGQLVIEHTPIQTDLNTSKFSIYGVTASKNRACWLFVGYPSKSFDHLSLRTPTVIFFCKFSVQDPVRILLENPTLRMTDFYDCAEVIRYSGNRNTQTLGELGSRAACIARMDDSYAYQLKLQLIQLGSRFSHFKKRCQSIADSLLGQFQFVTMMIDAIHAAKVIYYFLNLCQSVGELSYMQLLTVRCLRNFLRDFAAGVFPGDFEHVHITFKPIVEEIVTRTNELLANATVQLQQEECMFCGMTISDTNQVCSLNHQTFRCSITKQQIPVRNIETVCSMCDRYSLDVEILTEIFNYDSGNVPIYYRYCCLCDLPFTKRLIV
ncbi:uncharacterized protein LOC129766943 [Toxorhynchites rutilus septentrionalis]|uniref:uncharacterized protein LOC129766943 n=1 Tax=Toxorhynchites rutilus septentrionalis TaxID=329112 RepID=UPI00247A9479|nr:uncharacterized protein LOC129766943 [Toxorhynchites rutilus septentrionalis]